MRKRKYIIYRDEAGEWRWKLIASNGNNIRQSGEGYRNHDDCLAMVEDDSRANLNYEIIEEGTDGSQQVIFTTPSRRITDIEKQVMQCEKLIDRITGELRETKMPDKRKHLWDQIAWLKELKASLNELAEIKRDKRRKSKDNPS